MVRAVCSHCSQESPVETYQSINVGLDPELLPRVKDGSLFVWECPYCGARNLLKYETIYHDPAGKLMIWACPSWETPPSQIGPMLQQLEGYTLRRVDEMGDLVEKVNIHAASLDDVTMEMCKWVVRREMAAKDAAMADIALKFLRTQGADQEILFAFAHNGQMNQVSIGFNVYEDASAILSRHPGIAPAPGFARVDAAWLETLL